MKGEAWKNYLRELLEFDWKWEIKSFEKKLKPYEFKS